MEHATVAMEGVMAEVDAPQIERDGQPEAALKEYESYFE